jgi:hypothetical protein
VLLLSSFFCESVSLFSFVPHPHSGGGVCYRTPLLGLMSLFNIASSSSRSSTAILTNRIALVSKVAISHICSSSIAG